VIPVGTASPFADGFDAGFGFLGVTRLANGISALPYGDFSGKVETVIAPTTPTVGAGGGAGGGAKKHARRRKGYPRRVMIDGKLYLVANAEEERALLRQWRDRVEREAMMLALEGAPQKKIAKAKVRVVRAEKRLEEASSREDDWIAKLREEDEEILMIWVH